MCVCVLWCDKFGLKTCGRERFCHDRRVCSRDKTETSCVLSRQNYVCRDKYVFVATQVLLRICLSRQIGFELTFSSILLSR